MTFDEWYNELVDCFKERGIVELCPPKDSCDIFYLDDMAPDEACSTEISYMDNDE